MSLVHLAGAGEEGEEQDRTPGPRWERELPPVPSLLDVEELPEAIEVDDVAGCHGALHHQVVEHGDDVHDNVSRRCLVPNAPRQLLNQVADHLGCWGAKASRQSPGGGVTRTNQARWRG